MIVVDTNVMARLGLGWCRRKPVAALLFELETEYVAAPRSS